MKMNILTALDNIETSNNPAEIFKYKNTTSWINIKNYLYAKSLPDSIKGASSEGYFSKSGIYLLFLSVFHYIKLIFRVRISNLYVGAGSGLFEHDDKSLDSYLPSNELKGGSLLYLLSAEHPEKLIQHCAYLKKHNIVIVSYLLAPLKVVFTKLLTKFISIEIPEAFFYELEKSGVLVTRAELSAIHTRFIVSYHLYKVFLLPLRISKAYVVSAYSNTELISVLKEGDIEINELQHGLIGSTHRAYNYKCHSALLPTPNNVLVYNEFWEKELFNAGYYKSNQIKVTGRLKYSLVDFELTMLGKNFVVFTGQGGFYEEMLTLFREAEEILSKKNIELLYIPHPNEGGKTLAIFCQQLESLSSVRVLLNKTFTTEQYIYNSLAHISVYSSCHFDAIHYKHKTYVFDVMKDNPMQYYTLSYPDQYVCLKQMDENLFN
ncbi:hypothetical protein [Psychromonas hadalis]|uniref:hypothetical protein n=1 Tax=Psychromonas hadalis TaxID=211669 RepID=UPI0003B758D3|nr:hypothetical protein [Psychromonas hadalis]